ncbi:MAG: FAD-dependent oxidoreductase [Proteobacteria bacterium]|nr:FAD-dependent oxidoreductase [Pseudomonadota bacterium]
MIKNAILIIGGGPAGIITAVTARGHYPDKSITLVKSVEKGVIPCGIPYMFGSLENPEQNALSTDGLAGKNIKVVVDKATCVNKERKVVTMESGEEYEYEKLVLAVGSKPIVPPIKNIEAKGVYPILKEMDYLKNMVSVAKSAMDVVVIGGGFIGIEMADEIASMGEKNITVVEMLPNILCNAFDEEFCNEGAKKLKEKGVKLMLGKSVTEIIGEDQVKAVKLNDGTEIKADMVVLGIGAKPNSDCVHKCELDIGRGGGIWVNDYMRTSDKNIFAVGDCAEKRDFFTREHAPVMLASIATAEARIAGANIYDIKVVRINHGTIAAFSTYVNGLALGSAGLTERTAQNMGFEMVVGTSEAPDRHPGKMPGASKIHVKLVFSKKSKIILGGQVSGGNSVGEMINVIATAIQKKLTANEIATLQIATHPKLTAAPTVYPLVTAAQAVENM